eukprot:c19679_g1_i6.p1 GENE.c19679_g1_i6~~c19679_g1_i6.p1  ORF type:complete len:136 (+),score=23.92 c19679_g1_i6:254-661(+)
MKWTGLHSAAQGGHVLVIDFLLEHGAAINTQNSYKNTALSLAAMNGRFWATQFLLQAGADMSIPTCNGLTALQWAESQGKDHAAAAIREFSRAKHKVQFRMFLIGTHFRAGRGSAVRTLPIDILMLVSLQVLREL